MLHPAKSAARSTDAFLRGTLPGSAMLLACDWDATPIRHPAAWPASLQTLVQIMLASNQPMFVVWGASRTLIYNSFYAPILGAKHPAAMGRDFLEVWHEIRGDLAAIVEQAYSGHAVQMDDIELLMHRNGYAEETHFSFFYSPVRSTDGEVEGFFCACNEITAQVMAQRALRQSEERHRGVLANMGEAFVLFGRDFDVLELNDEALRLDGRPREDIIGRPVWELHPGLAESELGQFYRDTLASGSGGDREQHFVWPDGRAMWVEIRAHPVPDGLAVFFRDVTRRWETEREAAESAQQFKVFAQSLPNHVWTAPASGMLDWFNDRVYEYSGAPRGALDGQAWAAIVHPDDVAAAASRWAESLRSGVPYDTEFRIRRFDGEYRWHLIRALPLRDAEGRVRRWVGTNTDVHESRLQHVEVTRERDRIWALSHELMLVCDFSGKISAVNPAATRILGWPQEQMVGRTLGEFLHPDDVASTAGEVGKLSTGAPTLAFENRYRTKDGDYRVLSWTAVPEAGSIHAVARDVTRERATEEALRQSQKLEAIGQLTGGVAHDFNNELAVVRNSLELLRRLNAEDARRERFMEAIANAVTRASRLTAQLLAFARRQALQPAVFDARQHVLSLREMIGSLLGVRIEVEMNLPQEPCFIFADANQFTTAIVNLALNARDAMGGEGMLSMRLSPDTAAPTGEAGGSHQRAFVALSLKDTGCGILPEDLKRIFEPFFTTKGAGQGTGLGLSQVFGFAKQSGGDIQVESRPGAGAVFTLYLPAAERPADYARSVAPSDEVLEGSGECVLLVEDNPEVSRSVQQTLHELGYTPVVVSNAEEALEELRNQRERFSVVFSDVVMPGIGGVALAQTIRDEFPGLPVILSTGYSYALAQEPHHGFTLLTKPYSLQELGRVLHQAIGAAAATAN